MFENTDDLFFQKADEFFRFNNLRRFYKSPRSAAIKDSGYYEFIPYRDNLINALRFGIERGKRHFIDVGSGIGNQLYAAEYAGFQYLEGVEIDKSYIRKMKATWKLHGKVPPTVHNCDALMFDYTKYDFVYMYQPVSDPHAYQFLLDKLTYDLQQGAFLLEVFCPWYIAARYKQVYTSSIIFEKRLHELIPIGYLNDFSEVILINEDN